MASYHAQKDEPSDPGVPGVDYTDRQMVENIFLDVGLHEFFYGGFYDLTNLDLAEIGVSGTSLIVGGSSDNNYVGTDADDWIYGGAGADTLIGGGGNNLIDGGEGSDRTDYSALAAALTITVDAPEPRRR